MANGYRVERRALNGTFASLTTVNAPTVTFADSGVKPGIVYEYRVQAFAGATSSPWSALVTATAPGSATAYQQWLQNHALPMDESGNGAPTVAPAGDGIANFMKFALGLNPSVNGDGGRLTTRIATDGGQSFLSLTFTRPEPPPAGVTNSVKTTSDPALWSAAETLPVSDTAAAGTRTFTVRDTIPISEKTSRRLIRLETLP